MGERAVYLRENEGRQMKVVGMDMTVKAEGADTGGAYELVVVNAPLDAAVPMHRHPWAESYLVVDGRLDLQIGGRSIDAGPGDFVTVPTRAAHGLRVTTERCRFLHITIGDAAVPMFGDLADELPGAPGAGDIDTIIRIGGGHQLEFLPSTS